METVLKVLGWFVLATMMMAIARQLSEQHQISLTPSSFGASYNRPRASHRLLENFTGGDIQGQQDTTFYNPAVAQTEYSLLADVLQKRGSAGDLTAKTCYEKDFLSQSNKTGNFIQRTNNYRHGAPDNCSAPRTELVDSFYRNP